MVAGAGRRDVADPDWSPAATRRVDYMAQVCVFGAVMADAAMLDAALEIDVWALHPDARRGVRV